MVPPPEVTEGAGVVAYVNNVAPGGGDVGGSNLIVGRVVDVAPEGGGGGGGGRKTLQCATPQN